MVGYRQLFLFVEGDDDERFFQTVIVPTLRRRYEFVKIVQHSGLTSAKVQRYLASIDGMTRAGLPSQYLYTEDRDEAIDISAKRNEIARRLPSIREENIVVVEWEIEAWYLAGLDKDACEHLGLRHLTSTDEVTKEQFNSMMPSRFRSRINFMAEVLQQFSIPTAREKNDSFRHLADKLEL